MIEISNLNFVELSGSEQAVAEEHVYKESSIRNFVTRSFNGLSSHMVKSALKKKLNKTTLSSGAGEDGELKLVACLR